MSISGIIVTILSIDVPIVLFFGWALCAAAKRGDRQMECPVEGFHDGKLPQ